MLQRGKYRSYVALAIFSFAGGGCKTSNLNASGVKDDEVIDGRISSMPLGKGLKLPPIAGYPDIHQLQPALAVCVTPPVVPTPPPVNADCNSGKQTAVAAPASPPSTGASLTDAATNGGSAAASPADDAVADAPDFTNGDSGPAGAAATPHVVDSGAPAPAPAAADPGLGGTVIVDSGNVSALQAAGQGVGAPTSLALDTQDGSTLSGTVSLITSSSDVDKVLKTNFNLTSTMPVVSGGLVSQFRNQIQDVTNHFYVVFKLEYRGRMESIDHPAMSEAPDQSHFIDRCGNRFIAARQMGGLFFGVATFDNSSRSHLQDIQVAVNELRSSFVPGVQVSTGLQVTKTQRQALSSAHIAFTKIGGSDQAFDLTIDGLVAASRSFICTVAQNQAPLVAYLQAYRGIAPDNVLPVESDVTGAIDVAMANQQAAQGTVQAIGGYPPIQQPALAGQLATLTTYINTLQQAINTCRSSAAACNLQTLALPVPLDTAGLPAPLPSTLRWNTNTWYALNVHNHDVYCKFPEYNASKAYGLSKILVQFRGNDLGGQAAVRLQFYRAGLSQKGPIHETSIANLTPYLVNIMNGSPSNTMIADFANNVVAPLTGGDHKWRIDASCYAR